MRYRERLKEVEAFQWDGTEESLPEWFKQSAPDWRIRIRPDGQKLLEWWAGPLEQAWVGHYVVRHEVGLPHRMRTDEFESQFEPIGD